MAVILNNEPDTALQTEQMEKFKSNPWFSIKRGWKLFILSLFVAIGAIVLVALGFWEFTPFIALPPLLCVFYGVVYVKGNRLEEELYLLEDQRKSRETVAVYLENLDEDYTAVRNAVIAYQGKKTEADFVIVGSNGVFVIEADHIDGELTGTYQDKFWKQTIEQESFHVSNLAAMARDRMELLSALYKENHIKCRVHGMIYLTNPKVVNSIETGGEQDVVLFTDGGEMVEYIKHTAGKVAKAKDAVKLLQESPSEKPKMKKKIKILEKFLKKN